MLDQFLQMMVDKGASDLFVTAGFAVSAKINGKLTPLTDQKLSEQGALDLVHAAMNDDQQKTFHETKECNFAIARDGVGRFRCSAFWQPFEPQLGPKSSKNPPGGPRNEPKGAWTSQNCVKKAPKGSKK